MHRRCAWQACARAFAPLVEAPCTKVFHFLKIRHVRGIFYSTYEIPVPLFSEY